MRRLGCMLLALLLILSLTACGKESELSFTNSLSTTIENVYINSIDQDTWGDAITYAKISSGNTIHFDFEKIGDGPGIYDIGVIDSNAMNYDTYDVELAIGDNIALSGTSSAAVCTVTHADGTTDTYEAIVYENEE